MHVNPADVGPNRHAAAPATRPRLQREAVESSAMEGGKTRQRSAVIRARRLATRAATGSGS